MVPFAGTAPLAEEVSFSEGACLGIPGITAHRAVHVGGEVRGRTMLVQGGAGAVGALAVWLASLAGARVLATVRREADAEIARDAGADAVVRTGDDLAARIRELAPDGVDHIVEVAFGANVGVDAEVLAQGGSIAPYASDVAEPAIPYWPIVFANARLLFVGSDDIPAEAKSRAAMDVNAALASGWRPRIAETFALDDVALAHEAVERPGGAGRTVLDRLP